MDLLVAGLGGVGGFLGAKLAFAYPEGGPHRVYFLARGAHLEAVLQEGITLRTGGESLVAKPWAAASQVRDWPQMDLILLCVKGYQLQGILESLKPVSGPRTFILPLLNGIGTRSTVEQAIPLALVGDGAIYIFAHIQSPGVILHVGGPGRVVFGRDPGDLESLAWVRELLGRAGVEVKLVPRAEVEVWKKFVVLSAVAGSTALYGQSVGQILADASKLKLMEGIMADAIGLAEASGVSLPQDLLERTMASVKSFPPKGKSSLLHDLEAKKPSELDWLLGRALDAGRHLGVKFQVLDKVYEGIRARWLPHSQALVHGEGS